MSDQYISNYLTHWTGKDESETVGFNNLSSILASCQLWLGENTHIKYDIYTIAIITMACFTDIPLWLSASHCSKYGKFGIAFKKRALSNYGANPVFYFTHSIQRDIKRVYDYICELNVNTEDGDNENLSSLKRVFNFVKSYSDEREDLITANYYEREWRLLELNLELSKSNPIPPGKYGIKEINGVKKHCFQFKEEDIEFIIVPNNFEDQAENLVAEKSYSYRLYENLVQY